MLSLGVISFLWVLSATFDFTVIQFSIFWSWEMVLLGTRFCVPFHFVHKMNICTFHFEHFELLLWTFIYYIWRSYVELQTGCLSRYILCAGSPYLVCHKLCLHCFQRQAGQSQAGQREAKSKLTHLLPPVCNSSSMFPTPSFYENQKPLASCTSCFDGEEKLSKKKNKLPHIRISCVVRAT